MNENIRIQDIVDIIRRRIIMILMIPIILVVITGFVSYFVLTPVYEASTQLLVSQTQSDDNDGKTIDVQTNLELINTYNVIIKSPAILDLVNEEMNLNMSVSELSKQVSVGSEQNSQVVTIAVEDENQNRAVNIANNIANIFNKEIKDIMNIDNVTILSKATMEASSEPVQPRPVLNMLIVFTTSLLLMFGVSILWDFFDNTIKSEKDIKTYVQIPVMGSIQMITIDHLNKTSRVQQTGKGGDT